MDNNTKLFFQESEMNCYKTNFINWYDFNNHNSVLALDVTSEAIVEFLCHKFHNVTITTNNLSTDFLVQKYSNLTVIPDCPTSGEYGYIILPLQDSKPSTKKISTLFNNVSQLLSPDGHVLITARNMFGISQILNKSLCGFSYSNLITALQTSKLSYYNFYYLLPDIKNVNMVFSDNYHPSANDIRRNINLSFRISDDTLQQNDLLLQILNQSPDNFRSYVNYFLIDASTSAYDKDLTAVFYNNIRPLRCRLVTKLYENYATKEATHSDCCAHLNQLKHNIDTLNECGIHSLDHYDETKIISRISQGQRLDDLVSTLFKKHDASYKTYLNEYHDELFKLGTISSDENVFSKYDISIPQRMLDSLHFTSNGLWDLTLQNIFVEDNLLWCYDQEWLTPNIPLEFIMYRSIAYLDSLSPDDRQFLLNEIGLTAYTPYFAELETKLQEELTNAPVYELFSNTLQINDSRDEHLVFEDYDFQKRLVKSKELRTAELRDEITQLSNQKHSLDATITTLASQISELESQVNSRAYRFCCKLRKLYCPIKPLVMISYRGLRIIMKLLLKAFRFVSKAIYACFPHSIQRSIHQKIQYSNILSRLFGVTCIFQYVGAERLHDESSNTTLDVIPLYHLDKTIGIHLHLYYEDLLDEFYMYFNNIPYPFDLYVSTKEGANLTRIKRKFKQLKNLGKLVVQEAPNCGRDFGPMYVMYANDLRNYDYIMHVHSKKSLRTGQEQSDWRVYLLNNLLGSPTRIMEEFYMMENYNIGLVYPDAHWSIPYWSYMWLDEIGNARNIYQRLNIPFVDEYLDYSAGSMFWAKKEAFHTLLELNLTWEDFGADTGQAGGTLEYVFEKIPGVVTRNQGFSIAIYSDSQKEFLLNHGNRNLDYYYSMNAESILQDLLPHDVITFDIFDTLITRKIYNPDDAFSLIQTRITAVGIALDNYCQLRKDAEWSVRQKKNFVGDCTIHEIYDELIILANISKQQAECIKQIEIQTELDLCIPRRDSLLLYNNLLAHGKRIILISDMYLTKDILTQILNNCGYHDYQDLLVSSETGLRKDAGTIWDKFFEQQGFYKTIHVGDNEESDIHKLIERGRDAAYFMQGRKMYLLSNYSYRGKLNLYESVMLGCIVNRALFNSPFALYDCKHQSIIKNEHDYGYAIIAPIILKYMLWLIRQLRTSSKEEVILFAAREGYYLQRIYHYILNKINSPELNKIEDHYFYISRRAITVANIKTKEDVYEIMSKPFKGTLLELLYYRLGIKEKLCEDQLIELPRDFNIVKSVIDQHFSTILHQANDERQNYLSYVNGLIDNWPNKNLNYIDLGYAGTAQYYLSKVLSKPIDGKYFVVSGNLKPLSSIGCTIDACYNDDVFNAFEAESNLIYRYSMVLEAFLTAPHGQLQYFSSENGHVTPIFNDDMNDEHSDALEQVYAGVIDFLDDYLSIFKDDILNIDIHNELLYQNYKGFLTELQKLPTSMKQLFNVEDYYCYNGIVNSIDLFQNPVL